MTIGDHQLHAAQAARELAQEGCQERLGRSGISCVADVTDKEEVHYGGTQGLAIPVECRRNVAGSAQ